MHAKSQSYEKNNFPAVKTLSGTGAPAAAIICFSGTAGFPFSAAHQKEIASGRRLFFLKESLFFIQFCGNGQDRPGNVNRKVVSDKGNIAKQRQQSTAHGINH